MQFKHPEILFALFLLIIPIIVHLFQLQRFEKISFTNVRLLQRVIAQTRKSSQLKKWLILGVRMLTFTALIFAFAQPFLSTSEAKENHNIIIYLDNSLSMSSKINGIELLKKASQELIENSKNFQDITLITNDEIIENLDAQAFKNVLIELDYSTNTKDLNAVMHSIQQYISNDINTSNNICLISDFQFVKNNINPSVTIVNSPISIINIQNPSFSNVGIDSLYVSDKTLAELKLAVQISSSRSTRNSISISLYDGEKLMGKSAIEIDTDGLHEIQFKIPNQEIEHGRLSVEDEFLTFDNDLFFTIAKPKKINTLAIGKYQAYLDRIFTSDEFDFRQIDTDNFDPNTLDKSHLVILNELELIPAALSNAIAPFIKNGGNLLIIPSEISKLSDYTSLFRSLNLGRIESAIQQHLKITRINYEHPILQGVFEKEVLNFQYPEVDMYFPTSLSNASAILELENTAPFISAATVDNGELFWCASPLSSKSNFINSPLIVPLFYTIAKQSFKTSEFFYTIGRQNTISVDFTLGKDEVLTLYNETAEAFIPRQQLKNNTVEITTTSAPDQTGYYTINHNAQVLQTVAYNYDRNEREFHDIDLKEVFKNHPMIDFSETIKGTLQQLQQAQEIKPLFKWFLILAVVFLLIELCILNYFKA